MSIKTLKEQITQLQAQIWRNSQYLRHTQKQLALIDRAAPATGHRSRQQIRALRAAIARDSQQLEVLNQSLLAAIDHQPCPQIQEILTRRYVSDEPFTAIAAAMDYDLRWVYRLHARGLGSGEEIESGPRVD